MSSSKESNKKQKGNKEKRKEENLKNNEENYNESKSEENVGEMFDEIENDKMKDRDLSKRFYKFGDEEWIQKK